MSIVLPPRFVDPRTAARAAAGVLAAGAVLDLHRLLFAVSVRRTPDLAALPNSSIHLVVRLATIVLFVMWVDRVWSNSFALGGRPESSRLAAVYSFFVPPFCFFRPVQIIRDVWEGSSLASVKKTAADVWVPRLAVVWWILFWIPPLLILTAIRRDPLPGTERWLRVMAGETINIVAASAAIAIVHSVTRRQRDTKAVLSRARGEARMTAATPPPAPEPSVVAEEPAPEPMVSIAPAMRLASPGHPIPARPVERMIRAQRARRRSLEQALDALSPPVWRGLLIGTGVVATAALVASGALLIRDPRDVPLALMQLGFASLVAGAAWTLAREKRSPPDESRLAMAAASGATIAIIELISLVEELWR